MAHMKRYLALFAILSALACNRNNQKTDTSYPRIFDLGLFSLLDESINQLAYTGREQVSFIDENGAVVNFEIIHADIAVQDSITAAIDNVYDDGTGITTSYFSSFIDDTLRSPALNLELIVRLRAQPNVSNPGSRDVADLVEVLALTPDNESFQPVFSTVFNQRSWPTPELVQPVDEVTIYNRIFEEVWVHSLTDAPVEVWFNRAYGIVSLTDPSGKQWRFQQLQ